MYDNYLEKSLELHLFFARIMKEHSLFLKAGFTTANPSFSRKAEFYKIEFENLLNRAVNLSQGMFDSSTLSSGEFVTEFTLLAEKQTENLTGIKINKNITQRQLRMNRNYDNFPNRGLNQQVKMLNQQGIKLLNGLISFKEEILINVKNCTMFTMNYPLLIEHIIREAKLYRSYILKIESHGCLDENSMREIECFWNQIMMEHALFIRGLLDPSENELIATANGFADDFSKLLVTCKNAQDKTLTDDTLNKTMKFRDFKIAGTKGIEHCQIKSLILPLLADHVLREANHYIRLLKD